MIKGYHAYQIRSPITDPPTQLRVDREYTNIADMEACLVWLPDLETFNENVHDLVTDQTRQLKLCDIAGLPIGHVPRILAGFFRTVLDEKGSIYAITTGEPCPSFPPWPAPSEKGGGAVIPCSYFIKCSPCNFESNVCILHSTLDQMKEGSAMNVSFI